MPHQLGARIACERELTPGSFDAAPKAALRCKLSKPWPPEVRVGG